ncbi:Aspartate aminotransferase [ANME-1 cluster archaeon GoMg2]|nr:Aspartate aminotransferase [ANME-1 cluster archaeon GoMg2]
MIDIFESIGCGGAVFKGFSSYESCVTIGATQAISLVFRYLSKTRPHTKVLLLGYNYSIYDRCITTYKCQGLELIGDHSEDSTLPPISHVLDYIEINKPDLVVLTLPNNPSGELYNQSELGAIFTVCAQKGVYVLVDKVGLFDIPDENWPNVAQTIDESNAYGYTIIVNSFSKTCSIPGCRMGYIVDVIIN